MNAIGKLGCIIVIVNLCRCKIALSQQEVEVPDPNLRSALRKALSLSGNQPITRAQLRSLTIFGAPRRQIIDLTGLEHATNLVFLGLPYNEFSSLEPLIDLTKVETLYIYGNPHITDITPVRNMVNLTRISGDG